MIFKAIEFASKAHAGQFRKRTRVPYITHPLAVATILLDHGCSDELAVAAVLHDTIEDTSTSFDDIRRLFGNNVTELVKAATEPSKKYSWEKRKQHTLSTIQNGSSDLLLLVCADKLHNLKSIREDLARQGESIWLRFSRPKEKQRWYFTSLLDIFQQRLTSEPGISLVSQFEREVALVFHPDFETR